MRWLLLILVALPLAAPPGAAQVEDLYAVALTSNQADAQMEPGQTLAIPFTLHDLSQDSTTAIHPDAPGMGVPHQTLFTHEVYTENTRGWAIQAVPPLSSYGGQSIDSEVRVSLSRLVDESRFDFGLIATMQTSDGPRTAQLNFTVFTLGKTSFLARSSPPIVIGPDDISTFAVRVTNHALQPRGFDLEVTNNPCGLAVADSDNNLVGPRTEKEIPISIIGPSGKLLYVSEDCSLTILVSPNDSPLSGQGITVPIQVDGWYIDPVWVFWIIGLALAALVIFMFAKRRKERIEEEILGKPQKPWTIPVEQVYLRHLKARDERAWYMVRHHLMEEEYRSALMWYKAYKAATKGSRAKERLIVREEHKYERWKAKWQKRIAAPLADADGQEAKLQKKLDRKQRKQHRKGARDVRATAKKLQADHDKREAKAMERWEKEAKRAARKGLDAPPKPELPAPELPREPTLEPMLLADHKWSKKAERYRRRMERKQGNLEVRFEKADARRLRRVRRKVQKIARKLDDPDFVDEHPLLSRS